MVGKVSGRSPETREAFSRLLEMLPAILQDRASAPAEFFAARMAADVRKVAVVLDGLRRLEVYVPDDFVGLMVTVRLTQPVGNPLGLSAMVEQVQAGLLARASRFALPGLEVDWRIVRQAMRRAAVAVLDEAAASRAMAAMRAHADVGLIGVPRSSRPPAGSSDAVLAREADRIEAADPAAALAAALADVAAAKLRARRARRRIKEARRARRPLRPRRRAAPAVSPPDEPGPPPPSPRDGENSR